MLWGLFWFLASSKATTISPFWKRGKGINRNKLISGIVFLKRPMISSVCKFDKEYYLYFHNDFKVCYKIFKHIKQAFFTSVQTKELLLPGEKVETVCIILGLLFLNLLASFNVNMSPVQVSLSCFRILFLFIH